MSAYVVDKAVIDLLVTAGLLLPRRNLQGGTLRWWTEPAKAEEGVTHVRGEVWGPGAVEEIRRITRELRHDNADEVGTMLWAENYRSVGYRYDESEMEDELYQFREVVPEQVTPVRVLGVLGTYEYQACEHPDWLTSEAHLYCRSLEKSAIYNLPGYGEERITDETVSYQQGINLTAIMEKRIKRGDTT